MNNITLTGNIRYRMQLFTRKLILQVETRCLKEICCGPTFDSYFITEYKDATLEDLQNLSNLKENNIWEKTMELN